MIRILKITMLSLLLLATIGCYPPSYYDYWNARSTEQYLDRLDTYGYYPYTYYNPYYYPYPYFPYSFSFYYYNYPHHGDYYRGW